MSDATTVPITMEQAETDPMSIVLAALARQAEGGTLDADEEEACKFAGIVLAGQAFVRAGADPDQVMAKFTDCDYTLRYRWNGADDTVDVEVDWHDDDEHDDD